MTRLVLLLISLLPAGLVAAQTQATSTDPSKVIDETPLKTAELWSQRLTQEGSDSFDERAAGRYVEQGRLDWTQGEVLMRPKSSLTAPLKSGPEGFIRMELGDQNSGGVLDLGVSFVPETETRIGSTCVVEISNRLARDELLIRFLEYKGDRGREREHVISSCRFPSPESIESLAVHYRYGVVAVSVDNMVKAMATVPAIATPLRGVFFGAGKRPLHLKSVTFRKTAEEAAISEAECDAVKKLRSNYEKMVQFHRNGQHQEATKVGDRLMQTLTPIVRRAAPQSLIVMNDVAFAHQAAGDLVKAKKLYEQTLQLWLDIPGPFHPEVIPDNQQSESIV